MKAKVAVFGPANTVVRIQHLKQEATNYELLPFIYTEANQTPDLLEQAFLCDIFLFTESIAFHYVENKTKKRRLSTIVVHCDEYILTTALLQALSENQTRKRISLDGTTHEVVQHVLPSIKEAQLELFPLYAKELAARNAENILEHHRKLWEEGRIDYVLTAYCEIAKCLQKENIPVRHITIPDLCFKHNLDKVEKRISFHNNTTVQHVIGYFRFKHLEHLPGALNEVVLYRMQSSLDVILQKFAKQHDAIALHKDQHGLVLIGSKKLLRYLNNHFGNFPLLRQIEEQFQEPIEIGFGLGLTHLQAQQNAMLALEMTAKEKGSACYIVNESQVSIGPVGVKKQIDPSFLYQALIHKAKLNNELSYNFIEFIKLRNNKPFSSHDVANHYSVTKRSAERTINKLLTAEIIKVAGAEKPYQKGRPRKLFALC
ncbi:hypothetical protein [Oceanobacillus manasiensis]|uniref:hypothetical protein n=1 Tax=Oceanobacillus manasiensis TaxID=586413 RepID=UPI0005A73310|nr:hypothetical protein [Oceanobacillus manasiensis]